MFALWELKYIIDNIERGNNIKRYDLDPIEYFIDGEKHHYFPDFILNEENIVEIKGLKKGEPKTIEKIKVSKKLFGDKYLFIENVGQNISAKIYFNLMKEKYGERLEINYNPHEND
jgi:hypothetical protein